MDYCWPRRSPISGNGWASISRRLRFEMRSPTPTVYIREVLRRFLSEERFDCCIATHVIEHVYQPAEFMRNLFDRLDPGGALVISTPDMGSLWRRALGRRWPSFKIPEHVGFYDEPCLRRLFMQTGFTEIERLPYLHAFPLSLALKSLGLPSLHSMTARIPVWVPSTTLAIVGRRSR